MKKVLFSFAFLALVFAGKAQLILFQDFSNNTPGWVTSNGSSIGTYDNFNIGCATEYGIITPGVGGNNPAKVLSEAVIPNQQIIQVKFNIDRYDANFSCSSHSNFGCATYVDILAVASTYTGTDPIGDGAVIYSNQSNFLLPITGGQVSLNLTLPNTLPSFKVFFNFTVQGNCNQPGTKYVLDKFSFTGLTPCQVVNTCPPIANDDYFNSGAQGFSNSTLLGNVYGTNLGYTPPPAHSTNVTRSLTNLVISPQGGNDYDIDNHPLSLMTFGLLSQTFTAADATFTFNSDGTFSFLRLNPNMIQFFFTYRLTDPQGNFDDAVVRIDYSSGGPLPVSLINFKASKTSTGALLNWETSQEVNNRGFDVLRKTAGNFEKVAFIASKAQNGNSNLLLAYSFTDNNLPKEKAVYYRLSQVDINGKESYSDIRVINNGGAKQPLLIYPNPSRGNLQIVLPSDIIGLSDVKIMNAMGAVIKNITNTSDKRIGIEGLKTGIYTVQINSKADNTIYTEKIIVQ